jgi:uncharacterized protein (TIGR00297 family)
LAQRDQRSQDCAVILDETRHSEDARQVVHIAMGGFALLLRYLPWWQAVILAATAVSFNMWLLKRVTGGRLHRPSERGNGIPTGIVFYPTSVLLLLLLLPSRPDIVAAAWGIMAAGDGAATLVGRRWKVARIPWNHGKSVGGTLAFVVAGGSAGSFLAWWCRPALIPPPFEGFSLFAPVVAAIVAAAVETVPIRLDDNLSVPAMATLVMWPLSLVNPGLAVEALSTAKSTLTAALLANASVAILGLTARTVSASGAVCGFAIGTVIYLFAGWRGWLMLLAAFLAATIASRFGLRRKTLLGIAEANEGRRGAGNAIANTGIAAAAAATSAFTYAHEAALVAFAAALTAGASDTIASEIGKAWGRRTWLIAPLRRVAPGTSGALSLEGSAAGVFGALMLAELAIVLDLVPRTALVPIVAGATIGSFVESGLGATLEAPGILNNDALNFINTGLAAFAALVIRDFS